MFSKACEYGILATIYIATESLAENRVSLKDIIKETDAPKAFTAKILQQLVKHHIIESVKGPSGGFEISKKKINTIKLSQIVSAIDGDSIYKGCGLGLKSCSDAKPCPVHDKFLIVREELRKMLETTTLGELAAGINKGNSFLKREFSGTKNKKI